ncbi:MAG: RNA polymerase sigma factor [Dehalococcoidales bacterium]|nr:MAG: RNA polymerase sigma factor [Dehalococcoidales bacterium]
MDEVSVISSIRSGQNNAFAEIVEHYQAPIIRYLYRLTGNYETALDLTQETFLKAYHGILKTKSELELKPWLFRIATNNARQHHRRRRLLSFIRFNDIGKPGAPEIKTHHDHTDEEITVQDTLRKIPTEQRACLLLHYVDGFKYREIAETLGISEDAVRMRVARGKQLFRRVYNGGELR